MYTPPIVDLSTNKIGRIKLGIVGVLRGVKIGKIYTNKL